ncbi:MAG: GNAT family N-acetyltransferase, partial [Caldilineaceae bacterium]|nr:GNAT family N-acetyltransferase [Caldilineaceae bacterium]
MQIRPAHTHEIPQIAAIHEQTATVAYAHIFPNQPFPRTETLTRWQRFSGQILVAEVENVLVGFVAFDAAELHALYVLPEYQGQGIGHRLLTAAGAVSALWVLKENHAARRFYAAHGWAPDGTERMAFGVVEMRYHHSAMYDHCQTILRSVALVEQISASVGTTSYIWG